MCGGEPDVLSADTRVSLLSPVGSALTSGTTRIPATQTRTWWKTILRCSIVSGLELGLSCSKVVASACGCCCSVQLPTPPLSLRAGGGVIPAGGSRERPLRKLRCVTAHLGDFKRSHLNSWALVGNKPAAVHV